MTPHNEAEIGDYAETVLLPGDPDRARWIAETFLDNPRCVNRIRGCLGFTGTFRGVPVSIQSTGIGRPSVAIHIHELVTVYGARVLIRTGTCGGLDAAVALRTLHVADGAILDHDLAVGAAFLRPDPVLLQTAVACARAACIVHEVGPQVSSDVFYHPQPLVRFDKAREMGIRAVDMETSEVFSLASRLGARALSICTVVDNLATEEATSLSERQELFADMARLALEVVAVR